MFRKILLVLLVALLLIQFIRPEKNKSEGKSANHISNKYSVPAEVSGILEKSCNDCHSNNTVYPWYANIQPVAWWLQDHVNEGKKELNFSEFLSYSPKKARHKMDEVIEMVKEEEMPLPSYTWIHRNAKLTEAEKTSLTSWASALMKQIEKDNNLPPEEKK